MKITSVAIHLEIDKTTGASSLCTYEKHKHGEFCRNMYSHKYYEPLAILPIKLSTAYAAIVNNLISKFLLNQAPN